MMLQLSVCCAPLRAHADSTDSSSKTLVDENSPTRDDFAEPAGSKSSKSESTEPAESTLIQNKRCLKEKKTDVKAEAVNPAAASSSTLKDSAELPSSEPIESEAIDENDNTPKWASKIETGSEDLFYFVEAVSGKKLKPNTYDLLKGVTDIEIGPTQIKFVRSDKQELIVGADTTGGTKFYQDWEKSKTNLQDKFGDQGRAFLDSIAAVHLTGSRIDVQRKGDDELTVELGDKKLHPAFDLRSIKFRRISMLVDKSGSFPKLRDITGIVAVIKAPGFSFPVEVKDFCKLRLQTENDITVGVTDPVPPALRAFLFLPSIFHFHFRLKRKV